MANDIFAATVTATGVAINRRTRVKSIQYLTSGGGAGQITLKDGGSGGTVRIDLATVAVAGSQSVYIPDDGVLFTTNVHATLTNISSLTIFYG